MSELQKSRNQFYDFGCVSLRVVSDDNDDDDDDDDGNKSLYLPRSNAAMRCLASFLFRIWEAESQIKVGQVFVCPGKRWNCTLK